MNHAIDPRRTMNRRTLWIAGAAAAAIMLLATATAYAVVVGGKTSGSWDLPTGAGSGFAEGGLFDKNGSGVFKMQAKLIEQPSPSLSTRTGRISGFLDDGIAGFPIYRVEGQWKASAFTGVGAFEAVILRQSSPLGPIAQIGKMAGDFKDPPSFGSQRGKYAGEWVADL